MHFLSVCLNILFPCKCEHKCGLGDFLTFNIACIYVEGYHFLFQWYLHKLCNGIFFKKYDIKASLAQI